MSGVFKAIGQVFSKIAKVALKIAPYALAAAAVVFTGGAALGLLPAFGTVVGGLVGSLGLSAAVTGALTGAITSAGFGAALGFVTGGKKGLQKGALMGALTGGVLGMVNPATFGITQAGSAASQAATSQIAGDSLSATGGITGTGFDPVTSALGDSASAASSVAAPTLADAYSAVPDASALGAPAENAAAMGQAASDASQTAVAQAGQGIAPLSSTPPGGIAPAAAPDITGGGISYAPSTDFTSTPATAVSQATSNGGTDILKNLLGGSGGTGSNITGLIGSVLQNIGKPNQYAQESEAEVKAREQLGQWAYGGASTGHQDALTPTSFPAVPQPRYFYDKATNQIVDRQQPQGA